MSKYPQDIIKARDGSEIVLTFYAHASIGIGWNGLQLYIDPVGESQGVDFSDEPKADMILVTHHHSDHLDKEAISLLAGNECEIYGSEFCGLAHGVHPGDNIHIKNLTVDVVPAYNTTPVHLKFHPKERLDCGYILNLGGTRIYVAGDTEDNDDVLSLKNVDVVFLPVNQPYTMTVEQAVRVVKAIKPSIFYPYHYGSSMGVTDLSPLAATLSELCEVRLRKFEL